MLATPGRLGDEGLCVYDLEGGRGGAAAEGDDNEDCPRLWFGAAARGTDDDDGEEAGTCESSSAPTGGAGTTEPLVVGAEVEGFAVTSAIAFGDQQQSREVY